MHSKGSSQWLGSWPGGKGTLSTEGSSLADLPFDAANRFDHGEGGSPEELVAAAFAGCFNNAFANVLSWGTSRLTRSRRMLTPESS
jgi:lipoyl-dependent peroxiredoxin